MWQPPLGFLNPALYRLSRHAFGPTHLHSFVDVVAGENRCSSEPSRCCVTGFPAAVGWDPSTGLGTPNFTSIAEVLAADPCFGMDCGGGVCSQGRCMCKNGHGYDVGGRCVPLKPFPKKLVEEVTALGLAGAWLLVQLCIFLQRCCCAKKGKDDKRGCLARCCSCVCRILCCGNELQLQAEEEEDVVGGGEMVPMTMERESSASAGGQYSATGVSDDFESTSNVHVESTPHFDDGAFAAAPAASAMNSASAEVADAGDEVCSVCFLAAPAHEVWCPYYKSDETDRL